MRKSILALGVLGLTLLSGVVYSGVADEIVAAWQNFEKSADGCNPASKSPVWGEPRSILCHALSLKKLPDLAKFAQQAVFVSGPHKDAPAFNSTKDFGHYNAAFVNWAVDNGIPGGVATSAVYDRILKKPVLDHLSTLYILQSRPADWEAYKKFFQAKLASPEGFQYVYSLMSAVQPPPGAKRITDSVALAFWVRRSIDGTAPIFQRGFEKLAVAYSPADLERIKKESGQTVPSAQPVQKNPPPVEIAKEQAKPAPPAPPRKTFPQINPSKWLKKK